MILVFRLGFLAFLLLLWALAAQQMGGNVVPSPKATYLAAGRMLGEGRLIRALGDSLTVFLSGYALAIAVGVPMGILMGGFRVLGKTLEVYVYALAATPRVAFIPLIIVMLGLGVEAKMFIVFLGALMPVLINTYAGVLAADDELIEMAQSVGAGRMRVFRRIVLPGAVPFVIVGMRLGATIGLINTVVAELYTSVKGLGGLLAIYGNTFRMAEYFVVVLMLSLIGVVVTESLRYLEQRASRWRIVK
ncbi:MAG: ABC transporter permease [Rhodobacteraceae bacterium]|nr:ABC transporter permease [Paracoccaceae bacterium]MCF8514133.1 ABC transporter permease [Paracoccaceae bacterium]MCF8518377.1 ABC transporter permease [Paracoccaceae bacterium]